MIMHGIYGAGGFGREVAPLLYSTMSGQVAPEVVFIDDAIQGMVNGFKCYSFEQFTTRDGYCKKVTIAISDYRVRALLARKCIDAGLHVSSIISSKSEILSNVKLGRGSIIFPFVTLTSDIEIGEHFHAYMYSYVAHDCRIGNFVTFAPGVHCNGNVQIEDYAYVGTGAIIRQGQPGNPIVIGAGAVVGMGAVVTRNVPPNTIVVGNPAKVMVRK